MTKKAKEDSSLNTAGSEKEPLLPIASTTTPAELLSWADGIGYQVRSLERSISSAISHYVYVRSQQPGDANAELLPSGQELDSLAREYVLRKIGSLQGFSQTSRTILAASATYYGEYVYLSRGGPQRYASVCWLPIIIGAMVTLAVDPVFTPQTLEVAGALVGSGTVCGVGICGSAFYAQSRAENNNKQACVAALQEHADETKALHDFIDSERFEEMRKEVLAVCAELNKFFPVDSHTVVSNTPVTISANAQQLITELQTLNSELHSAAAPNLQMVRS